MTNEATESPILFAYDGSDGARKAIAEAAALLRSRRALVLALAEPAPPVGIGSGPALDAMDKAMDEATLALAEEGAALAAEHGFTAEADSMRSAPVWQGIVDKADAIEADAIVVGSKGRTGLSYVLLGSVATAVSQHAKRPVLIIH